MIAFSFVGTVINSILVLRILQIAHRQDGAVVVSGSGITVEGQTP